MLRAIILVVDRQSLHPQGFEFGLVRLPVSAVVFARLALNLEIDEDLLKRASDANFLDLDEYVWFWA